MNATLTILLVEDDENWRTALQLMYDDVLSRIPEKVRIVPCMSGEEALRRFDKNEKFDLLSLDLNLGGKGKVHGPEVLQKASETQACRGVILISAIGDEGLRTVIKDKAGLQDLLQRPEDLLERHGFKANRGIAYSKQPIEKLAPEDVKELRDKLRTLSHDEQQRRLTIEEIELNIAGLKRKLTPARIRKIALPDPAPIPRNVFCPSDDRKLWEVAFNMPEPKPVRAVKGFRMLALILSNTPGRKFAKLDLLHAEGWPKTWSPEFQAQAEELLQASEDSNEIAERSTGRRETESAEHSVAKALQKRKATDKIAELTKERNELLTEFCTSTGMARPRTRKTLKESLELLANTRNMPDDASLQKQQALVDRILEVWDVLAEVQKSMQEEFWKKVNDDLQKQFQRTCQRLEKAGMVGMARHLGGEPPRYSYGGAIERQDVWYYRPDLAQEWECES